MFGWVHPWQTVTSVRGSVSRSVIWHWRKVKPRARTLHYRVHHCQQDDVVLVSAKSLIQKETPLSLTGCAQCSKRFSSKTLCLSMFIICPWGFRCEVARNSSMKTSLHGKHIEYFPMGPLFYFKCNSHYKALHGWLWGKTDVRWIPTLESRIATASPVELTTSGLHTPIPSPRLIKESDTPLWLAFKVHVVWSLIASISLYQ